MKRFTDTDIWDKEWFMTLPPKLKCLVKFVRDKCDHSGVWQPNWVLAVTYIGEPVTEKELLSIDDGKQFEKMQCGKIYCSGFVFFQYGELKDTCMPHRKVISLLQKHGIYQRVLKGYQKGIKRDKDKDKEEDKDTEEEKERLFNVFWDLYDKKVDKSKTEKKFLSFDIELMEKIILILPEYVKSKPDPQFRKNPLTYLNGECWNDEIEKNGNTDPNGKTINRQMHPNFPSDYVYCDMNIYYYKNNKPDSMRKDGNFSDLQGTYK